MRSADKIIEEAMRSGAFDDLAGKGQPLDLDMNPNADPEWELAYHLLKENGFAPAFIEERKLIEKDLAAARQRLVQVWERRMEPGHERRWAQACGLFETTVAGLNKKIREYNLSVPHDRLARTLIQSEAEIARLAHEAA